MTMSKMGLALTLGLLLIPFSSNRAKAQSVNSSIQGTVQDSSGAILPGTQVTLTNTGTGVLLKSMSDAAGNYSFPSVRPGVYSLEFVKPSFAKYTIAHFDVIVGQHATENATLGVASAAQTVTVNAQGLANLLQPESNDLGNVIAPQSVSQLPLNGRNYLQLGLLSGATQSNSGAAAGAVGQTGHPGMSINIAGNEPDFTMYLVNGIQTFGSRSGNTSLNLSVGAIDQFEVHYGFFMPDLGPNPGIVDVITKSGSNKFHGEAYEYVRNNQMEARNYFSSVAPGPYHQNQFGADLGGPILRSKLFFFGNYEGYRQVQSAFVGAYTPTAAMFNGDFSGLSTPVYNPFSVDPSTGQRQPFAGNVIPSSMINPVSQKLLKYYLPGSSLGQKPNNVGGTPRTTLDSDQVTSRFDGNFNERNQIFGQFSWLNSPQSAPGLFPLQGVSHPLDTELIAMGWTDTLGSTKVNELRLGWVRDSVYQEGVAKAGIQGQLGITGTGDPDGVPGIGMTGYSGFGTSTGLLGDIDNVYQIHDSFSWLRGKHQIKFGADLNYTRSRQSSANATARGSLSFTNEFSSQITRNADGSYSVVPGTGNAFADFLLGVPTNGEAKAMPKTHFRWTTFAPYVQDTWKVRPHLTANIALAWFANTPPNPSGPDKNLIHGFDFNTGEEIFAALGQMNPEVFNMTWTNYAPRVGLSWQPRFSPKTVVRSGWGMYYTTQMALNEQYAVVSQIISVNNSIANSEPTPTYLLGVNTFPAVTIGKITADQIPTIKGPIQYLAMHQRSPYVEQWNLDVEHTFGKPYLLDVAYIGNQAHHLAMQWNPIDCSAPDTLQCSNSNNPFWPRYPYMQEVGSVAQASYNALQVKFQRQFSGGFSLLANYTWAKTLTNAQEGSIGNLNQRRTCFKCDIGMSTSNVPQSVVVSAVWDIPLGRNKRFGSNMNRWLDAVIGGWNTDVISAFQKGNPFTVTAPNFTAWSADQVRANRLCNGRRELQNKDLRTNGLLWIQRSCFAQPPTGYFGNSGFDILTGPGIDNWDLGVHKTFTIHEETRLDVRGEFFNALNHTQFANPDSGVADARFGQVTSTQHDAREAQIGMRLSF